MAQTFTVDASIFLNAFNPREAGHALSRRFLAELRRRALPIIVPWLLLAEIAAAVARGRDDEALARRFARTIRRLPHLTLVPVDEAVAEEAIDVAAEFRLRGSDAIYAAIARRYGTTLVTLDREQRERVAAVLPVCTPQEALDLLPARS